MLRGELRLDDRVSKYVTELHGGYISRVTIGRFAIHTSGLLCRRIIRHGQTPRTPLPNSSTC
jgi:CubicO group peptidase (beta-lactamase class C family)